jgi:predicted transcriptional regulator
MSEDLESKRMATDIVCAYVSSGHNMPLNAPGSIEFMFKSVLAALVDKKEEVTPSLIPAISIKKSVTDDYIICLEDGRKLKSIKRHLKAKYGLTPDEYRKKWDLPHDYPMVCPNYSKERSQLAKEMGLGSFRKK